MPQPTVLKNRTNQTRFSLPPSSLAVEELIRLETPLEKRDLQSLVEQPDAFFFRRESSAPTMLRQRANPPRRVGAGIWRQALVFFNDMSTDAKAEPNPSRGDRLIFKMISRRCSNKIPRSCPITRATDGVVSACQQSKAQPSMPARKSSRSPDSPSSSNCSISYQNQSTEAPTCCLRNGCPRWSSNWFLGSGQDTLDEKLIGEAERAAGFCREPR